MAWIYAVFRSRTEALDCAAQLAARGVAARAVSSPREANAGCSLSLRVEERDLPRVRAYTARAGYATFAGFLRVRGGAVGKF